MALDLPPALSWVFKLVGCSWPDVDEDRLAEYGRRVGAVAPGVRNAAASMGGTVVAVAQSGSGPALSAFTQDMQSTVSDGLPQIADGITGAADEIRQQAVGVEYSKGSAIVNMAIMAPTIAEAIAAAPETFGASLVAADAAIAALRASIGRILLETVEKVATSTAMAAAGDLAVQGYQVLVKHDRTSIDGSLTLQAVEAGAIGGALDGVMTGAAQKAAPGWFKAAKSDAGSPEKLAWSPPSWAAAGQGMVNNTVTNLAMDGIEHQPVDGGSMLDGLIGGAAAGAFHRSPVARESAEPPPGASAFGPLETASEDLPTDPEPVLTTAVDAAPEGDRDPTPPTDTTPNAPASPAPVRERRPTPRDEAPQAAPAHVTAEARPSPDIRPAPAESAFPPAVVHREGGAVSAETGPAAEGPRTSPHDAQAAPTPPPTPAAHRAAHPSAGTHDLAARPQAEAPDAAARPAPLPRPVVPRHDGATPTSAAAPAAPATTSPAAPQGHTAAPVPPARPHTAPTLSHETATPPPPARGNFGTAAHAATPARHEAAPVERSGAPAADGVPPDPGASGAGWGAVPAFHTTSDGAGERPLGAAMAPIRPNVPWYPVPASGHRSEESGPSSTRPPTSAREVPGLPARDAGSSRSVGLTGSDRSQEPVTVRSVHTGSDGLATPSSQDAASRSAGAVPGTATQAGARGVTTSGGAPTAGAGRHGPDTAGDQEPRAQSPRHGWERPSEDAEAHFVPRPEEQDRAADLRGGVPRGSGGQETRGTVPGTGADAPTGVAARLAARQDRGPLDPDLPVAPRSGSPDPGGDRRDGEDEPAPRSVAADATYAARADLAGRLGLHTSGSRPGAQPTGTGRALTETALMALAEEAAADLPPSVSARHTDRDASALNRCAVFVERVVDRNHPSPPGAGQPDDGSVRPDATARRLAPEASWLPAGDWYAVDRALRAQPPGAMAIVLTRRPGGLGHAQFGYRPDGTLDKTVWIDLADDGGVVKLTGVPNTPMLEAKAVILDGRGRAAETGLERWVDSSSIAHSLIDPASDHRYGASRSRPATGSTERTEVEGSGRSGVRDGRSDREGRPTAGAHGAKRRRETEDEAAEAPLAKRRQPRVPTVQLNPRLTVGPSGQIEALVIHQGSRTPSPLGTLMGDHTVAWQAIVDSIHSLVFGRTLEDAAAELMHRQKAAEEWLQRPHGTALLTRLEGVDRRRELLKHTADRFAKSLSSETPRTPAHVQEAIAQHLAYLNYLPFATVPPSGSISHGNAEGTHRATVLAIEVRAHTRTETHADENEKGRRALWGLFSVDAAIRAADVGRLVRAEHLNKVQEAVKELKRFADAAKQPNPVSNSDRSLRSKQGTSPEAEFDSYRKVMPKSLQDEKIVNLARTIHICFDAAVLGKDKNLRESTRKNVSTALEAAEQRVHELERTSETAPESAAVLMAHLLHKHQETVAQAYPHAVEATDFLGPDQTTAAVAHLERAIRSEFPDADPSLVASFAHRVRVEHEAMSPIRPAPPNNWARAARAVGLNACFDARGFLKITGRASAPRGVGGMGSHSTAWFLECRRVELLVGNRGQDAATARLKEKVKADLTGKVMQLDHLLPADQLAGGQVECIFDAAHQVLQADRAEEAAIAYLAFRNLLPYATVDPGDRGGHGESMSADMVETFDQGSLNDAVEVKVGELEDVAQASRLVDVLEETVERLNRRARDWDADGVVGAAVVACTARLAETARRIGEECSDVVSDVRKNIVQARRDEHHAVYRSVHRVCPASGSVS